MKQDGKGWLVKSDGYIVGYELEDITGLNFSFIQEKIISVNEPNVIAVLFKRAIEIPYQ